MVDSASTFATYPSLRGRAVLITGGASGIGEAMVRAFAAQGSRVAFIDSNGEAGEALARELASSPDDAPVFATCDLRDIPATRSAIAGLTRSTGEPLVLINNAANDDRHQLAEVTPAYWDDRMAVNLRQQFFVAQAVMDGMKAARTGSILNMSSIAWMIPSPDVVAYATAKAGIVGLTRSLARELGGWNIRVNCILPGSILTERQRRLWMTPAYTAEVMEGQMLKRHLLPDEVARLALFLAADDSSGITGQRHVIDAGWISI